MSKMSKTIYWQDNTEFKKRAGQHKYYVEQKSPNATGEHFNLVGHSISDMLFFGIEKVTDKDPFVIGARERFYIDKFKVVGKGLNKNRTN